MGGNSNTMKLEGHEKSCLKKLGKPYTEVHLFLDQFFDKYKTSHRILLHHQVGVDLVVKHFGEDSRQAAITHIIDDFGFVPASWIDHKPYTPFQTDKDKEGQKRDLIIS